jgi:serine/threonine protein kinase
MPNTHRITGGKPVFAGAQGCVFDPALKCKHRPRDIHDGNVSKLVYTQSAEFEMRAYDQIRQYITQIKNYDKYFNMRASVCEPDALGPEDLAGFNNVCHLFTETSIDASNVNANLNKLRAINMPNLGTDLKGWMEHSPLDAHRMRRLNDHISELLVRAVVPMNRLGVMHNDLKSENLMMDRAGANVRIIDWGLAGIATPQAPIPERYFMNNAVTFNRPFSTMLISDDLRAAPAPEEVAPFVARLYREYRDLAPTGHDYYVYIFKTMFGLPAEAATRMVHAAVEKYNADILRHYTDERREFRLHDYFSNVYRYNTDVWGTLSVFYIVFMLPRSHFILPDAVYHDMLRRYRALFTTSVFVNGHLRMNVPHIVGQLRQISEAITKPKHKAQSRFKVKTVKKTVRFNLGTRRQSNPRRIQRVPTPYPLR